MGNKTSHYDDLTGFSFDLVVLRKESGVGMFLDSSETSVGDSLEPHQKRIVVATSKDLQATNDIDMSLVLNRQMAVILQVR